MTPHSELFCPTSTAVFELNTVNKDISQTFTAEGYKNKMIAPALTRTNSVSLPPQAASHASCQPLHLRPMTSCWKTKQVNMLAKVNQVNMLAKTNLNMSAKVNQVNMLAEINQVNMQRQDCIKEETEDAQSAADRQNCLSSVNYFECCLHECALNRPALVYMFVLCKTEGMHLLQLSCTGQERLCVASWELFLEVSASSSSLQM